MSSDALCIGSLCVALRLGGLSRVINVMLITYLLIFILTSKFIIFMFKTFFLTYMYTLTTDDHSLQMTVVSLSYDGFIFSHLR